MADYEKHRIKQMLSLIPHDVNTVVDVSCGDGRVTNIFSANGYKVVGLDISANGLKRVNGYRILSNCTALPFKKNSFDIAVCAEVLEHLALSELRKAVEELQQVIKKYVLITVPYEEDLELDHLKCSHCRSTFHGVLHINSFSTGKLSSLFSNCKPVICKTSGLRGATLSALFYRVTKLLIGYNVAWTEDRMTCPLCGNRIKIRKASENLFWLFIMKARSAAFKLFPKKPHNLEVLFQKNLVD